MPEPKKRIRWVGDVTLDGGKDGYINEIRVARIHRTAKWEDTEKPFCLDYAHGLHCASAHFDTIREAMDATEGLLTDVLDAIDAEWLPEDERWIVQMLREEGKRLAQEYSEEDADALYERFKQRLAQQTTPTTTQEPA